MRLFTRFTRCTTAALLAGLLLAPAPAAHALAVDEDLLEEPCFATCGQYKWFLNHSKDVRDNAGCCIALIKQAKKKEEKALELFEAARDPRLESWEQGDLVDAANALIKQRGKKIRQFIDCVNGVIRSLSLLKRGFDPTVEYAEACRLSLECELAE